MDYRKLVNESPAVIGMITSTLQSGGSVDTAIRSIAESGPKLSRIIFAQAVRTTDTKGYPSLKGALTEILSDLPKDSSGYCRAVMMILSASESSDSETRERMLRDSADIALDSVREMGESYGASLTVPCMTVFGIGIMVPMILMSILPMLNVGGMFGSKSLDQGTIVMVTLAIVPSFIMMVALYLRSKNPFLNGDLSLTDMRYGAPLIASIPLAIIYLAVGTDDDWMLLFSLAPSCIATLVLMSDTMYKETKRRKCEMSLMDSVFDIGNRMLSGYNFERAGVDSMHSRNLLSDISDALSREFALCRGDIRSAICSVVGPVSSEVSLSLQNIQMCSEKSNDDAGKLAVTLGKQFQNRTSTQRDLDMKLKSTTDMMIGTAMFFAPMVLGMSVSMLEPLSGISGFVSPQGTTAILGTYLIELCILISLLVSSLGNGEGLTKMIWRFCLMCPVSLLVFTVCCSISL